MTLRLRACLALLVLALTAPLLAAAPSAAATLPPGFTQRVIARGLVAPVDLAVAPDGRLFVAEKAGRVRIRRTDGSLTTFLRLGTRVATADERGLSGIALDPRFADNGFVYLNYTRRARAGSGVHNEVIRVTASGDRAVAGSERVIFRLDRARSTHHVGGALSFGGDGKLYITAGDDLRGADAPGLDNLRGKVLRINRDGSIPASNPFFDRASGRDRAIWARGLRNPFKVDRRGDRMFVNDVGEQAWEEINRVRKGRNYGWPSQEGPETLPAFTPPVFAYGHGSGTSRGCAITAGAFYDPERASFPRGMVGDYFFADLCGGWTRRYDAAADRATGFATGFPTRTLVDLEVDTAGRLLVLGLDGRVIRISHPG